MKTIDLQEYMQGAKDGAVLTLCGEYTVAYRKDSRVVVGKSFADNIFPIEAKDFVLDGSGATILFECVAPFETNVNLFYIAQRARNVEFRNLTILVVLHGADSAHTFTVVNNTAYGFKMINCRIEVLSYTRIDLVGVQNTGNADTPLETTADNFQMLGCTVSVCCQSENYNQINRVIGVNNTRANSISIAHNYIMSRNRGNGIKFETVGFYTNGRFGRFVGNNIKSHCTHGEGTEKEHAHAYGMINHGWHTLISANNIVAEWAGMSVGLEEGGLYTEVETNKILATHTIYGRSVRLLAEACILRGNVITSTSRNARLIEIENGLCVISGNILGQFRPEGDFISGCGIYCIKEGIEPNIITENIIRFIPDCGILYLPENAIIEKNYIQPQYSTTAKIAGKENRKVIDQLDAGRIHSITV